MLIPGCSFQPPKNIEQGSLGSLKINSKVEMLGKLAANIHQHASTTKKNPQKNCEGKCKACKGTHQRQDGGGALLSGWLL